MAGFNIPMWTSPLAMACDLDPKIVRTPALELIDAKLVEAYFKPRARLLLSMPPQEGKTWMVGKWFLIWTLWMDRRKKCIYTAFNMSLARDKQNETREAIKAHGEQLAMTLNPSVRAKNEWQIAEGGGVFGVGIGTGLSGRRADLLVVDDPFPGPAEADSEIIRAGVKQWFQGVAMARLATGAPVVVMHTRWRADDLIGWLDEQTEGEPWEYLNIPAQADHDPAKGEIDPLGREPGEFMKSAQGRPYEEWVQRKISAGSRLWAAMYQGRPAPAEGVILKREWWRYYDQPLWIERSDGAKIVPGDAELLITVDCAFKDREDSDYVAMQVWMRRDNAMYLLDQVNEHLDAVQTAQTLRGLSAVWPQAALKLIEEAANGAAVMAMVRSQLTGMVGEIPQGSKKARAYATTPYLEAGNIYLPDPSLCPWVTSFVEQAAVFDHGTHDDMVDTYSMAVNRLLIQPLEGEVPDARTEEERWYDAGFSTISPF